jgi:hypothetical protein
MVRVLVDSLNVHSTFVPQVPDVRSGGVCAHADMQGSNEAIAARHSDSHLLILFCFMTKFSSKKK